VLCNVIAVHQLPPFMLSKSCYSMWCDGWK